MTEVGTLPVGISFTALTGILSGIAASVGSSPYTVSFVAGNSVTTNATQTFTLTITAPVVVSSGGVFQFSSRKKHTDEETADEGSKMNIAARRQRQKALGDLCRYLATPLQERESLVRNKKMSVPQEWPTFIQKSAMGEGTGASGGYLVPVQLTIGVEENLIEHSVFHRLAYQQPMESEECDVGRVDLTAAHATGVTPLIGGLTMGYGTRDGTAVTTTTVAFASNKLVAHSIIADVQVTNQLRQDGGEALGAKLEEVFSKAIKWNVERQCLLGAGTAGQFLGITNAPGTNKVSRQTSSQVTILDIGKMSAGLLPASFSNCIWMAHPTTLQYIAQFSAYVAINPDLNPALCGTLLGRPLYVTENLNPVGTAGDLVLFDPTQYALGTRSMSIDMSDQDQTSFYQNMTTYRLWWRGDGQPTVKNTVTLADGSTTSGCYVMLQ